MNETVKIVEIEKESWEELSKQSEMGLFLAAEWIESVTDTENKAVYLVFFFNDQAIGQIAGISIYNGWVSGHTLYFYSGPYLREWNADTFERCLTALLRYAKTNRYSRLVVKSYDYQVFKNVGVEDFSRSGSREFIINYNNTDLKYSSNFIRNVKKAVKTGAVFYKTRDIAVLEIMLSLINNTYETRFGKYGKRYDPMYMPNLNRDTLIELLKSGLGYLNCAALQGEIHSVMFTLEKDKKVYFLLLGSSEPAYKCGLPAFLSYNVSEEAKTRGVKYYNMGLIPDRKEGGEGVRRFKESQGAQEVKSYSYKTLFLSYPWCLINVFFRLGKLIPHNGFFEYLLRLFRIVR